jgi:hypothetical protein
MQQCVERQVEAEDHVDVLQPLKCWQLFYCQVFLALDQKQGRTQVQRSKQRVEGTVKSVIDTPLAQHGFLGLLEDLGHYSDCLNCDEHFKSIF